MLSVSGQSTSACLFTILFGLGTICAASTGGGFLKSSGGAGTSGREASDLRVEIQEVESSLRESFQAMVLGDEGPAAGRFARVERSIWQTFQSLPKNSVGRLASRAVRYIVHSYFAKEHGWLIKGLEPHGMQANVSEVHEMSILQDRAPALVEALLVARHSDRGLAFGDVVAMVATLERLIFEESIALLEASYSLNDLSASSRVDEEELHEILRSYLLVFEMGMRVNLSDVHKHQAVKAKLRKRADNNWLMLVEFEQDAALNFQFARRPQTNPFVAPRYSFEAASRIVQALAQDYGKWQNSECRQMKEELISLDPDGTGRVPLGAFYSQPETADYQFTESVEYLRTIGALDEAASGGPQVRIANYMMGPSNCIASSSYYSVCCLSDCEALMNELEEKIQAPAAPAVLLLGLVANLTSSSYAPEAPRLLRQELHDRMHAIAERHGGGVPLHGRLFAQWLHFAFPQECPYPHLHESTAALTPGHWQNSKTVTATKEERQRVISEASGQGAAANGQANPPELAVPGNLSESVVLEKSDLAIRELRLAADLAAELAPAWSDDEVLPLLEPLVPDVPSRGDVLTKVRVAVQLVLLLAAIRMAFAGLHAVATTCSLDPKRKKTYSDLACYV